jgi:uncharacterized surface protein with fasciclin (FAS1) repeats
MNRRRTLAILSALPIAAALPAEARHWTDIPARLGATPSLSTLRAALEASGLMAGLYAYGQGVSYTLFAPTNDAFAALPRGTLDSLLRQENKPALENVLRTHLVLARVKSDSFIGRRVRVQMSNGAMIGIDGTRTPVVVNGTARVLALDDEGRNGVIHVIDRVILPG